jgi:hypothetical protein
VRTTPEGLDAPAWHHHRTGADRPRPAWAAKQADPAWREITLQPREMLLRRYTHLLPGLTAAPAAAGTLWEAPAGQVTARNRLHRDCGLTHPHPVSGAPPAEAAAGAMGLE